MENEPHRDISSEFLSAVSPAQIHLRVDGESKDGTLKSSKQIAIGPLQ